MTDRDCARVLREMVKTLDIMGPFFAKLAPGKVGGEGPLEMQRLAIERAIAVLEVAS